MRPFALVLLLAVACAPSLPRAFAEERAAAERAYAAGRYDEAAVHWEKAEAAAERRRDQTEARYRRAASLIRAGRHTEAQTLLTALRTDRPKSSRAARAAFDAASIEIEHGDPARGWASLEAAIFAYPESGVALAALRRVADERGRRQGTGAALSFLRQVEKRTGSAGLREQAGYDSAKLLESLGRDEAALAEYLRVAASFPYPEGALWDDALFAASLLEEKLGRPKLAIERLERMLAEREPSSLQGSYERPRYAAARLRIAELYRDRIGDKQRAAAEFHRVWDEHPTSLLKDDALWQAARIERELGREDLACKTLRRLTEDAPDSRFARCARALCPSVPPVKGECHAYVLRQLTSGHD